MGKYSYSELKKAAQARRRIGGYEGEDVFAISKHVYDPIIHSRGYYVLYDDNNKLVRGYAVHGTIDENGNLDLWKVKGHWYNLRVAESKPAPQKTVPASAYSAVVAVAEGNSVGEAISSDSWFSKLDREISELLAASKSARYEVKI